MQKLSFGAQDVVLCTVHLLQKSDYSDRLLDILQTNLSDFDGREARKQKARAQGRAGQVIVVAQPDGLGVQLRELMRADLDGDTQEEILIFSLTFAPQDSLRASITLRTKMKTDGILWPEWSGRIAIAPAGFRFSFARSLAHGFSNL
jgi:hypothetical protein